jgi:hypothetical protein
VSERHTDTDTDTQPQTQRHRDTETQRHHTQYRHGLDALDAQLAAKALAVLVLGQTELKALVKSALVEGGGHGRFRTLPAEVLEDAEALGHHRHPHVPP